MKEKKWYIVRIYKTRLMGINERRVISETFLLIRQGKQEEKHGIALIASPKWVQEQY